MQDDKLKVVNYAMHYGVGLGFFWAFKYLFHIGATYFPMLDYVYIILGIGTFFLLYYLVARYRDRICGGSISYGLCVLFSVLLCFFASLIEAVVSYMHYTIIDPSYVSQMNAEMIQVLKQINFPAKRLMEADIMSFGPLYYIFSQFLGNLFFGLFVSLFYGFMIVKKDSLQ